MWKRACDTASQCIAEAKEYNEQRYDKTHVEPDFKEGDQELVSTLNFNNLKRPKKHPVFAVSLVKPYFQTGEDKFCSMKKTTTSPDIVEVEDSPEPVKRIIKARKIILNCKGQTQYLVRFKNQTADKE
ncbi:hypothetical protein O181_019425 [Austropuccinia psidii MF-1]|uniref:Uncharacterized protein n=1 Tax=Austropuccinia psidii MF-1 TaxID=1389203 RepID=A0A9Q3GV13_9BASI|nr:hypothetical protein [Austropuccinia psidii MF-1]